MLAAGRHRQAAGPSSLLKEAAHAGAVPGPCARPLRASIEARVVWEKGARVAPEVRAEVERLVSDLAPALSEIEADADTLGKRASCGLEWLLPRIELTLPLYERGVVFRLRITRDEATDAAILTRSGSRVATVRIL